MQSLQLLKLQAVLLYNMFLKKFFYDNIFTRF